MKLTFKNVGQGDSIIIERKDNNKNKIGIIDANKEGLKTNPTLEYLKSSSYRQIDFILLSHPHYDHFSGLEDILDYCDSNTIIISYFYHTSFSIPENLLAAVKSITSRNAIFSLFKKANNLKKKGIIGKWGYIIKDMKDIKLNDDIFIKYLAPSEEEHEYYKKGIKVDKQDGSIHNNPLANWLSTLLKIYSVSNNWYCLLTSDLESTVFIKSRVRYRDNDNEFLILGQVSHHGANKNLNKYFWKHRKKIRKAPAVISVGPNIYSHPSEEVIKFYIDNNYNVYTTLNSDAKSITSKNADIEGVKNALDQISSTTILMGSSNKGDQVFEFIKDKIYYQGNAIN